MTATTRKAHVPDMCNVLIVAFNNEKTVVRLLESLEAHRRFIRKVVFVDNGSTDATVEIARGLTIGYELNIIESINTGFAGGYASASAGVLDADLPTLCLNPDVELAEDSIVLLLEALNSRLDLGIATVPLVGQDGTEDSASRRTLPQLGSSALYGILGKIVPRSLRYNNGSSDSSKKLATLQDGTAVNQIQATTGALMMIRPSFRPGNAPIFDTDYWMYGEDLQLCLDAATEGYTVGIVEARPSLHLKGASSGWPRSRASHRAFHDALYIYYSKNLRTSASQSYAVHAGVELRFWATLLGGNLVRRLRG